MKKSLLVLLTAFIAFTLLSCGGNAADDKKGSMKMAVKNPDTFIVATFGTVATLDPAVCYDSASGLNVNQIYDKLIDYDRGTPNLVPILAEEVPTFDNGGISPDGKTYRFKVKKNVKFHDGSIMTPEDVEYSIERTMVIDVDGGPQWMFFMPFFNDSSSRKEDGTFKITYKDIDKVVEVDGDYVVFHLKKAFEPFLGIMAGYWAGVVNKDFAIANGGWDGTDADMARVNNPGTSEETLYDIANGSGPYKLDRWIKGDELVVTRFEDYHGELPAIKKGVYKIVSEWSTRKLMFLQGDVDQAVVQSQYFVEMENEEGILFQKDLPTLSVAAILFNQKAHDDDNPYLGSGKYDGKGIESDFFASKDARLAFVYAWDEETYLADVAEGFAQDPISPFPYGLAYKHPNLERLPHDLEKSAEYFKKINGGELWEKGFSLELAYNDGNETRGGALRILAENINSLNDKFDVKVRSVLWAEYLDLNRRRAMPIFLIGWNPDYPDMDNYAQPFMASDGHYAKRGSYSNPEVDELIIKARYSTDPEVRKNSYYRIQEIWVEDAVGIANHQAYARQYYRDWVKFKGGFYYQPNNPGLYNHLRDIIKE